MFDWGLDPVADAALIRFGNTGHRNPICHRKCHIVVKTFPYLIIENRLEGCGCFFVWFFLGFFLDGGEMNNSLRLSHCVTPLLTTAPLETPAGQNLPRQLLRG